MQENVDGIKPTEETGMGRGLQPPRPVVSVERTPAVRPLVSIGRASGSTSGSALELVYAGGGGAAKICIPFPRDFGSYDLFADLRSLR